MIKYIIIFLFFFVNHCSFDNKTGIWKDASQIPIENSDVENIENNRVSKYEDIFISDKLFDEEKIGKTDFTTTVEQAIKNNSWKDEFLTETNNVSNILYDNNEFLEFKSSKLSNFPNIYKSVFAQLKTPLLINNQLISYDHRGKIYVYDLKKRTKIIEYNFYKKAFKKYKKKISLVIKNNTIFAADNLGYIYAIDIRNGSLIWAKNYGIPFRSNIKVADTQIIVANEENTIFSIDISNGNVNWKFDSTKAFLNNDFLNNIVLDTNNKNILFLNTSGELYSINYLKKKINWVLNFKNTSFSTDVSLFLSKPIILKDNNLIVSTSKSLFNYNAASSQKIWSTPISSALKPVATKENIYLISKNKLLICLDMRSGEVIWSKRVLSNLKHGFIKKKTDKVGAIINLGIVNNKINIYTNKGFLFIFDPKTGKSLSQNRILRSGISANPIFYNGKMILINNKNKLYQYQ